MAKSKKKSSARAASAAKAGAVEPATDDLDELATVADRTPDEAADDSASADADPAAAAEDAPATRGAAGKDPVKRSRVHDATRAKDSVPAKGSRKTSGKGSGKGSGKNSAKTTGSDSGQTSGSEVSEKAKDATRSTSPRKAAAAETARTGRRRVAAEAPNPAWLAPTAVVFLILGLLYLVTFYLSAGTLPLPIGDWNLAAGFGVMLVGGGMLMFWK